MSFGVRIYQHSISSEPLGTLAVGDRLQFTAPDKKIGVANRELGTIGTVCPGGNLTIRFLQQHPRVQFHFTPTYSSWLNQVEIWFAKIEREVIARGIFTSVPELARKLRRYIKRKRPESGIESVRKSTF